MTNKPHVLVSGASVAGPALAYWLIRAGCQVTLVERASSLRLAGQGIDIRDAARDVVKQMGIFERIREKSSHEEGIEIIGSDSTDGDRAIARFAVDQSGKGDSFTSDVEILRGELGRILYDATKDDVRYIFGEYVESLKETENNVEVTFANGTPTSTFDLVVAADGMGSRIRDMAMGNGSVHIRSLNAYVTYFSIPPGKTDTSWARCWWAPGGRNVVVRPDNIGRTRCFVSVTAYDGLDERLPRFAEVSKEGIPAQKALVTELFKDCAWETPRILGGMQDSDDFYQQHIAQVRLDRWSSKNGRVSVVGDAGYAPSPFTGMGTSLAFIGAYVLAGEISKQLDDIPAALHSYERVLRPYVEQTQKLPPGIPWIVNPQSALGIKVLQTAAAGVSKLAATGLTTVLSKIAEWLPVGGGKDFKLPEYEAFKQ